MERKEAFERFTTELQRTNHAMQADYMPLETMKQFKVMLEALVTYLKLLGEHLSLKEEK